LTENLNRFTGSSDLPLGGVSTLSPKRSLAFISKLGERNNGISADGGSSPAKKLDAKAIYRLKAKDLQHLMVSENNDTCIMQTFQLLTIP
jgi:hypothetical protein